jgi:transposase
MALRDRLILNDAQGARMAPHLIGDDRSRGTSGQDNRFFVEAVLWIVCTSAPWRDLPNALAIGTAPSAVSVARVPRASGIASSPPWSRTRISST